MPAGGSATTAPSGSRRRPDIQGLRALAVLLVVGYHLRPERLSGGFVGVDVFFVISGFLIIGSLAREGAATGTVALGRFYAHRARRLLPASLTVVVVTLVASLLLMPLTRWEEISRSAAASAVSVQNLVLAFGTSEYAAASALASPFQHFWSLSVEEQFYLVVPLLVVLCTLWGAATGVGRRVVVLLTVIGAASFGWSVWYTASADGAAAYYSTVTRVWELVLGGLLALSAARLAPLVRRGAVSLVVGWVGLALVVGAAVGLESTESFPGWVALVPTVGTALILLAGMSPVVPRASLSAVLSWRLPVYVGDISYSLYLWHWPVIVLWAVASGQETPTRASTVGLLLVCLVLAAASERWIERPFRRPWRAPAWWLRRRSRRAERGARHVAPVRPGTLLGDRTTVAAALCAIAGVLLVVAVPALEVRRVQREAEAQLLAVASDPRYPGALVLSDGAVQPVRAPVLPDPVVADDDLPIVYRDGCNALDVATIAASGTACRYGAETPTRPRMVVLGDSHAAQLVAPLSLVAEAQGRELLVLFRDGCPFSMDLGPWPEGGCLDHNQQVLDLLASDPPGVAVITNLGQQGYQDALQWSWPDDEATVRGFQSAWRPLVDLGAEAYYVHSVPFPSFDGPSCVSEHGRDDPLCSMPWPGAAPGPDLGVEAARSMDGVGVVDLDADICSSTACRAVEGNVLVYRDNHLSETYARTLAPSIERQMVDSVLD